MYNRKGLVLSTTRVKTKGICVVVPFPTTPSLCPIYWEHILGLQSLHQGGGEHGIGCMYFDRV